MPKKKVQFPKRNKKIKSTAILSTVIAVVLIAAIVFGVVFHNHRRSWILEFNGERIPRVEFELLAREVGFMAIEHNNHNWEIFESSAFDLSDTVKTDALEWLKNSLALSAFVAEHGITIDDDAREDVQVSIDGFRNIPRNRFARNISDDRIIEFFASELLQNALIDQLGGDAEIDMDEFEEAHAQLLEDDLWLFLEMYFSVFVTESLAEAQEFMDALRDGRDFHELLIEFDETDEDDYDEDVMEDEEIAEDDEEEVSPFISFDIIFNRFELSPEYARMIANLQVGEHSVIINSPDGFFGVLLVEEIEYLDFEELRQDHWNVFERNAKTAHVAELFDEFREPLEFEVNRRTFNSVNISRLVAQ